MDAIASNISNYTIYNSFDYWLHKIGSSHLVDTLHCFVIPILSLVGVCLNLLGLLVLADSQFKSTLRLYDYLRAYLLNSLLICILGSTLFITARRYVYPNAFIGAWYFTHVFCKTMATIYFYASVLDILVLLDRLSILNDKFKIFRFIKWSTCRICLTLIATCVVINSPYYFMYTPSSLIVNLSSNEQHTFYHLDSSEFLRSMQGRFASYALIFIRELIPTILQLLLGICLFWMLKTYLSKKSIMLKNLSTVRNLGYSKGEKTKTNIRKDDSVKACSSQMALLRSQMCHTTISKVEHNAILMVLSNTALSLAEHILTLWGIAYSNFYIDTKLFTISAFALLAIIIKHSMCFLLFICFDKKIRSSSLKLIFF
jgi:hypothetical protein